MPLIECLKGSTTQHVLGVNYVFDRDRAGRYVADVAPQHKHVFLAVSRHYREVDPLDAPGLTKPQRAAKTSRVNADAAKEAAEEVATKLAAEEAARKAAEEEAAKRQSEAVNGDDEDPAPKTPDAPEVTSIKGIGAKMAAKLEPFGLTTLAAIAALTEDQVGQLDEALKLKGAIGRDKWIEQAKSLLQDDPAASQG